MAFSFEKLLVYQKAVDFADIICDQTEQFERGYGFLADQLNRAALSISNNIAEGNGRFTKADRRHFFGISRGSVQECVCSHARTGAPKTIDHRRLPFNPQGQTRRNRADALWTDQGTRESRALILRPTKDWSALSRGG
jgi:hypothetical protein